MFSFKLIRIFFCLGFVLFGGIVSDAFLLKTEVEKDAFNYMNSYKRGSYSGAHDEGYIVTNRGWVLSLPDDWDYYFEYGQPLTLHISEIFKQPLFFEISLKGKNIKIPVNSLNSSLGMKIFVAIAAFCYIFTILGLLVKKYSNDMIIIIAMLFGLFSCILFF